MRLIDADEAKKIVDGIDTWSAGWRDFAMMQVDNLPTVDAVEVVRCKDCQYSRPKKSGIKLHCAWWYRSVEDEDFCSRGRRKEE